VYFTINPTKEMRKNIPRFAYYGNGIFHTGSSTIISWFAGKRLANIYCVTELVI
jgi:hypothetical protein